MPMPHHASLPCYHDTVRAEWVDYNGHLRDAFYMLIFSFATDALIDVIGLPDSVRKERGRSIYTLEAHINYLHEIKEGAQVRVDMRVLGHDAKRLHLYLEMFADDGLEPVAHVRLPSTLMSRRAFERWRKRILGCRRPGLRAA
jgi:acyl-CoA thioester hydrolase